MICPVQYISSVPPLPPPLCLITRQGHELMTPNLDDNKKHNRPSSSFPAFRPPPPVRSKISTSPFLPHACHITSFPCIHIFKMGLTGPPFKKRITRYTTPYLPLDLAFIFFNKHTYTLPIGCACACRRIECKLMGGGG